MTISTDIGELKCRKVPLFRYMLFKTLDHGVGIDPVVVLLLVAGTHP